MSASRKPPRRSGSPASHSPSYAAASDSIEAGMTQRVQELYGSNAPTAVAYYKSANLHTTIVATGRSHRVTSTKLHFLRRVLRRPCHPNLGDDK